MDLLDALLLLAAFVLFALAAVRRRQTTGARPVDLLAAGLACWVLVPLLDALQALT